MTQTFTKDNTVLAKLFAEEDIHVVHKQAHTASFNVKKRELVLPILKFMSKDIQDLMTLHEVGHALFTSLDMLQESIKRKLDHSFVNVIEDGFVQIAGGKLTGFRLIAQEALKKIYNKDFDLKKLKFVKDIINLSETYKEDEFVFAVKHYCVAKPTDYLLRRTHASWFNENGDIKNLKEITDKFYSTTQYDESYKELV